MPFSFILGSTFSEYVDQLSSALCFFNLVSPFAKYGKISPTRPVPNDDIHL